jgi:hypothetical protein
MKDLMIGDYRVVCVSATAPETYNVLGVVDNCVGNIKLRRGVLEVRYPNFEGEVIYSTQPYGAIKANGFDKPYERAKFIQIAVDAIDRHIKNLEKPSHIKDSLEHTFENEVNE